MIWYLIDVNVSVTRQKLRDRPSFVSQGCICQVARNDEYVAALEVGVDCVELALRLSID